jgi:hypothetical protein
MCSLMYCLSVLPFFPSFMESSSKITDTKLCSLRQSLNFLKSLAIYITICIYFQRKPVKCIKAASALNRLLILCDSSLLILNMHDLEIIGGGPKLRGISTFCVNENPNINNPFCIQV